VEEREKVAGAVSHPRWMVRRCWHVYAVYDVRSRKGNGTACGLSQRLACLFQFTLFFYGMDGWMDWVQGQGVGFGLEFGLERKERLWRMCMV
jgi:hypothetical protein